MYLINSDSPARILGLDCEKSPEAILIEEDDVEVITASE